MTASAAPLGPEEFAAMMRAVAPFDTARRVVVAVSGGGDSMALAVLLAGWGQPLAAIVDHGLRPDSAAEAVLTRTRLEAVGIPSVIVGAHLAPGPARAERAREARYRLLFEVCRVQGRPDLLVAHHAADQAETIRMRQEAGSGPAGLAGMPVVAFHPEARLLRPLLAVDPARLRATLRLHGVEWVEDPSNGDPATARGRLRAAGVELLTEDGAGPRAALEAEAARELSAVRLAPEGFAVVARPLGPAALSALIWSISGRGYPPPRAALAAGLAARTSHGVLFRPAGRLGLGTLVTREPAAVAPGVPARAGTIWDGRFRLRGSVPPGLQLGALGAGAGAFRTASPLPAAVLASLPALRRGGEVCIVPHLHFPDTATCRSLRVNFCPRRPVVPAPFGFNAVNPSEGRGV